MSERKRVCVVIVNYRTAPLSLNCLASLKTQLDPERDCVVIVDNNSGGNDVDLICLACDQQGLNDFVHVIAASENNGFSAGNNIGINRIVADYYLLTNSDTIFREHAISKLLKASFEYSQAAIISPRLEWTDGEPQISCFSFHSPFSELIHSANIGIITFLLKKYKVPQELSDEVTWPEWASFACIMIKREVFDQIGLLDEGYFMYYEDVDFCRRAKQAGFTLVNYPQAHVVHLRGQSSGLKKKQNRFEKLPAYYYRSRSRYFAKFYGRSGFWLANFCWYVGWIVYLVRGVLLGRKRTLPKSQFVDIWQQ